MNQNFNFNPRFKQKILDETKIYTTRILTSFRLKCDMGDSMYMFIGLRTVLAEKITTKTVLDRWTWSFPFLYEMLKTQKITLEKFVEREGFDSKEEFFKWFENPRYDYEKLITYKFEEAK